MISQNDNILLDVVHVYCFLIFFTYLYQYLALFYTETNVHVKLKKKPIKSFLGHEKRAFNAWRQHQIVALPSWKRKGAAEYQYQTRRAIQKEYQGASPPH